MKHTVVIDIDRAEYERINRLLDIPSLSELTDSQLLLAGANTDHYEGVFCAGFDDGSTLSYDLCSGQENYFDDVIWVSPDKQHDICLECTFELSDISFEYMGELYEVRLNIV